ncbi:MAG: hypothetical protein ABSB40_04655 [Nitrososphaeria archaeon]|jgi:hypothetical protein
MYTCDVEKGLGEAPRQKAILGAQHIIDANYRLFALKSCEQVPLFDDFDRGLLPFDQNLLDGSSNLLRMPPITTDHH